MLQSRGVLRQGAFLSVVQRPTALRIASAPLLSAVVSALLALLLAACGEPGVPGAPGELGEARLLASAYEASRSRLVLIDPERPNGAWEELAAIEHAEGWDIEGVVAPSGDAAALLALPPGRSQPRAEAVLWLVTATERRVLAEGLDLYAGLAFSQDGERLAVARSAAGRLGGRLTGRLELLNARSGAVVARYEAAGPAALNPAGAARRPHLGGGARSVGLGALAAGGRRAGWTGRTGRNRARGPLGAGAREPAPLDALARRRRCWRWRCAAARRSAW